MFRPFASLALVALTVSAGCSDPDSPPPDEQELTLAPGDCATISVPPYATVRDGLLAKCVGCHSVKNVGDARHGAPDEINFDTYEDAKGNVILAYPMVKRHLMPYPDGNGVTNAERNRFYEWAICGTPP